MGAADERRCHHRPVARLVAPFARYLTTVRRAPNAGYSRRTIRSGALHVSAEGHAVLAIHVDVIATTPATGIGVALDALGVPEALAARGPGSRPVAVTGARTHFSGHQFPMR